ELLTFRMERPNLYWIKGEGMTSWSDGHQEGTFVEATNQYFLKRPGRRLPGVAMLAFGMEAVGRQPSNFEYQSFSKSEGKLLLTMKQKSGVVTMIDEKSGITGPLPMTLTF